MPLSDTDAIRVLVESYAAAVTAGTAAALEGLLDCNVGVFAPDRPVLSGRAAVLDEIERGFECWRHNLQLTCAEVIADARWGFCSGTFGLRSTCTATRTTRYTDGKFLSVARKGPEKAWLLYRICYSSNLPRHGPQRDWWRPDR